jgi:PAS domain S-box-containing protein
MIGELDKNLLDILFDTLPVEFSVVDGNDEVLAWNKHKTRLFKRPEAVLGRNVRDCHPKSSLDKVEKIISEMRSGKRDNARFWIDVKTGDEQNPQKILIEYYALRDPAHQYLGCLEVSQNITEIQNLKGQKRLLD